MTFFLLGFVSAYPFPTVGFGFHRMSKPRSTGKQMMKTLRLSLGQGTSSKAMKIIAELQSPNPQDSQFGAVALRDDRRAVAIIDSRADSSGYVVGVWDVATPHEPVLVAKWETETDGQAVGSAAFLGHDRLAVVRESELNVERVPSGKATNDGRENVLAMRGGIFVGSDDARESFHAVQRAFMYGILASPDGRFVALMNRNNNTHEGFVLDTTNGERVRKLPREPLAFSADGRYLAAYVKSHLIGVFDRDAKWKPRARTIGPFEYSFHATISPDGARLVVVGKVKGEAGAPYRPVSVWDLETGALVGNHGTRMRAFAWLDQRVMIGMLQNGNAQILAVP
jgi:hypothetical protein